VGCGDCRGDEDAAGVLGEADAAALGDRDGDGRAAALDDPHPASRAMATT
jgi:hypothetical protein